MADESLIEDDDYEVRFREDEELEFYTELALHETERWIQAVTKKNFAYPEDFRKSLENGALLCELANCFIPGSIRRINRLPTPLAGLDNINVFLKACKTHFGLSDGHLFNPSDLEDLSQRAIGESDRLKEEYDKRLRNVAVTVYWLGRYATHHYQGPQLDQSAFSALVHRSHPEDNIVEQGFHQPSPTSGTWDWAHTGSGLARTPGHHHARDGSLDSFSKDSVGSLEAQPTMNNGSSFQGSPDPISGSVSNRSRRYSSTDSLEDSVNSGHSRQGSDSNDTSYPTRRMSSTQMLRRQSSSGDPLQFIKGKPATDLAQLAQAQIKVATESKKVAVSVAPQIDDDPTDWLANLSTWKNRRKSQSERSYLMKEELEKMEREKEGSGEPVVPVQTKTYSQMQEDRERRKSTGRHFYPIEDEEEEDVITPIRSEDDKRKGSDDVFTMTHKPKAAIAPWARDDNEEERKDEKGKDEKDESSESDDEISNDKENENSLNKESSVSSSSPYSKSSFNSKDSDSKINSGQNESFQRSFASQHHSTPPSNNSSSQDIINRSESFKSMGPRTQSKIGDIMKNFQDSQSSTAAPKHGYNEKIDLKSRMKSFENSNRTLSTENQNGVQQRTNNNSNFNNYRNSFEQNEDVSSSSSVSHSVRERSKSSSSESKRNDSVRSRKVEKNIKIRQKPNDDKGFGFILTGGTDQDKPLTVSRVALGSGADICEVKVQDEIVSINQIDISDKTSLEVGDMVSKAVSKGYIDLRVHRDISEDDLSDEGMTSSSDEGEENLSQHDEDNSISSQPPIEMTPPMKEPVFEEIQPAHVDRVQLVPTTETYNSQQTFAQEPADEDEGDEDEEDGGPPAILRKWQRQRQRNEYTFENSPGLDTQSPVFRKISMNAPIPKVESENNEDEMVESKWRTSKPWDQRQEEWTRQQDETRMPEVVNSQNNSSDNQAMFDSQQNEIKRQYEESLKIAEQRVEERSRQEDSFLQPEMDKARILEERRMQRRNRIQETAAASVQQPTLSSSSIEQPLFSSSVTSSHQQPPPPPLSYPDKDPSTSNASHVTSMTFNIEAKENTSPASFSIPRQQPGNNVIVIDPRNRGSPVRQGAPLEFQVKLAPKPEDDHSFRTAQEEREIQRERELEEEKKKTMREKERQLQEQEEQLRLEREKLHREREQFREQQQLQQQQQQQQQQMYQQQKHQQYHHSLPPKQEYPFPHSNPPVAQSSSPSSYINSSSVSPVHNAPSSSSPYYSSSPNNHQGPLPSSKPTWPPPTQRDQPRGYDARSFQPVNNSNFAPVQPQFNISSSNVRNLPQDNYGRRDRFDAPQDNYGRRDRFDAPKGGKFSREDILAMNKKPFQEPEIGRVNQMKNESSLPAQPQNRMPIAAEPAIKSQNQINSLNSAPKARLRDDSEWKDPSKYQGREPRAPATRESGARRPGYGTAQDHWLVQEAERRRVSGQAPGARGPPLNSGPIKPLPDISNRWRDNTDNSNTESMPHAIRQTLLQKTAGARGSDGSAHEGDFLPPPQQQAALHHSPRSGSPRGSSNYQPQPEQPVRKHQSYSMNDASNRYNINPVQQIQQPPPPTLHRAPPPHGHSGPVPTGRENGLPVNGSQLCSHCNQELGFGAAMVIESLGIFFHLQCFRCCVCHASLGTGVKGADVRVRMNKLHCQNCYSNDEAGLKFSKV